MHHTYLPIICFAFFLTSCLGQSTDDSERIIAEVKDQQLTLEEVRRNLPAYIYDLDSTSAIRDYRRNWVNRQLLLQEANRLGLANNEDIREKIRRAEQEVLATALLDLVKKEAKEKGISRQEAQNYYENHRDQFILNERHVRYRHMITESMRSSQNAKNALMRGVPWEEVAQRYSIAPDEAIQNSRMYWPISTAAHDYGVMNQYLNVIGLTEISPIAEHNGQYHFVQLREDKNEGEHPDLEWVLDHITEWLLVEKQRRMIRTYERNLFLKADSNNEIRFYDVLNFDESKEIPINSDSDTLITN